MIIVCDQQLRHNIHNKLVIINTSLSYNDTHDTVFKYTLRHVITTI